MIEQKERAYDYLAILFSHAIKWETGSYWTTSTTRMAEDYCAKWHLNPAIYTIAYVHGHLAAALDGNTAS